MMDDTFGSYEPMADVPWQAEGFHENLAAQQAHAANLDAAQAQNAQDAAMQDPASLQTQQVGVDDTAHPNTQLPQHDTSYAGVQAQPDTGYAGKHNMQGFLNLLCCWLNGRIASRSCQPVWKPNRGSYDSMSTLKSRRI